MRYTPGKADMMAAAEYRRASVESAREAARLRALHGARSRYKLALLTAAAYAVVIVYVILAC